MTVQRQPLTAEDVRAAQEAIEYCYEQGWTDGLPIVPPSADLLEQFLAQTTREPGDVLFVQEHLERECTVRDAAVNAIMAGCLPEYFPVVIAAMEACTDALGTLGYFQSATGGAQMLVVNGPIRERLGINSTQNIFGPGDRPNATIGRTMRLIILNVFDVRPHELDQSAQGTPAKYSCCFGENEEESPWEPLHVEMGFPAEASTVAVRQIRSTIHVENRQTQDPEQILLTIAHSMSYAGSHAYRPQGNMTVVLGPEHANLIAAGGWSKSDVRQFLWEHYGNPVGELRRFGKIEGIESEPDERFHHLTSSPDEITVVVSGALNAGVSTVVPVMSKLGIRAIEEA
jgi:hypothetical protein